MVTRDEKPGGLERLIAAVAPQWAYQRQVAREKMAFVGAWKGASRARAALAGWNPVQGTSADEDNRYDLPTLRARSRDLVRSSPLAGGAIGTVVSNVVGTGLSLDPTPDFELLGINEEDAEAWEETVEREFRLWAESSDCDITRTQNFYGLQSLAFRAALESGDVLVLTPNVRRPGATYATALQLIEADRVCNPGLVMDNKLIMGGIERDQYGAPLAYHIASDYPVGFMTSRANLTWTRVPAFGGKSGRRSALHLFDKTRPGQSRGVPYLANVIEPLKQLDRYSDAELQAAVISGAFAVFVKMDPTAFGDLFGDNDDYLSAAKSWDGALPTGSLGGPGNAINLLPGESVETANPGRPNAQFDPFVQAVLRQIGVGLGLPFEVLIKHFTASYSAARAALLDAWRFFRGRRDWLATQFCQPLYEIWLDEAVASGRVVAPGYFADPAIRRAWSRAAWVGDGPGSIDPVKEVLAAKERVALGISTRANESIMYDGVDWDDKHRQLVKEETARLRDGLTVQTPAPTAPAEPLDTTDDPPPKSPGTLVHVHNYLPQAAAPEVHVTAAMPAQPAPVVQVDNHIAASSAVVQVDNHIAAAAAPQIEVRVEAIMPEQAAPVVQLDMPAPTVILQQPARTVAIHERDPESLEILRTVTTYEGSIK
jgi:lambda family phage portal protein